VGTVDGMTAGLLNDSDLWSSNSPRAAHIVSAHAQEWGGGLPAERFALFS